MTPSPGSPRITKGAIVNIDKFNPLASVIIFQYNPKELSRTLTPGNREKTSNKKEALRISGAAEEKIDIKIEIDASDQLERGEGTAVSMGIHPQLAALEMMLYPKSAFVIKNTILAALGTVEVTPPDPLLTLFIWGAKRVLPVKITSFSVKELNHDVNLNPIQAEVDLGMDVLTYSDFTMYDPGYYIYLSHQVVKEVMATIGSVGNIAK